MQLSPNLGTGSESQQPDGFAAVTERHDKQACPPVLARLWVSYHRASAVIDLGFFPNRGDDDSRRLRLTDATPFANVTLHTLIATAESILGDQVLPDRLRISAPAKTQFDGF